MTNLKYFIPAAFILAIIACAMLLSMSHGQIASAARDFIVANPLQNTYVVQTLLSATSTTATSTNTTDNQGGYVQINGAEEVLFYFSRTGVNGNQGSTVFKVQVSPDGTSWYDYNELGQITNTLDANSYFNRVGTTTVSGTTTQMFIMDDLNYFAARCIAVKTTDGEATCKAAVQF